MQDGEPPDGFRFDQPIAPGGYVWWRLDALSDDRRQAITLIAFLGNVFSPHYVRARRRGTPDPLQHCAMHVALHGHDGTRRAMTERWGGSVIRWPHALAIGPSAALWDGQTLSFAIEEITAPWPSRLRGTVRVHPGALVDYTVHLDAAGRHRWSPLAARARVEVEMGQPALRWSGPGFLDRNAGDGPPEDTFHEWTRSCASVGDAAAVLYDVLRRDGTRLDVALRIDRAGRVEPFAPPPAAALPDTVWRLPRATRADVGHTTRVVTTLIDAPFHARSVLETHLLGAPATAMHEVCRSTASALPGCN